jgi:circadian clock protein KaiB
LSWNGDGKRHVTREEGGSASEARRLVLYVAGETPKSVAAIRNLERICREHPDSSFEVEVIDLKKDPRLAREHGIIAIPTLVRSLPVPIRKIIGDLSDTEKVLVSLSIRG